MFENNKLNLTVRYHFKGSKEEIAFLRLMTHISKNMYNMVLYQLRQYYFKNKTLPEFKEIYRLIGYSDNRRLLTFNQLSLIIGNVYNRFRLYCRYHNYDGTIKNEYKYKITNDKDFAKFPNYISKKGTFPLMMTNIEYDSTLKIKKHFKMELSDYMIENKVFKNTNDELLKGFILESGLKEHVNPSFKIPRRAKLSKIKEVTIVPRNGGKDFYIHIAYEIDKPPIKRLNGRTMGIDLGINNLCACAVSINDAFLIDGRRLKSIIRIYNKRIAQSFSLLPKIKKGSEYQVSMSKHIIRLYDNKTKLIDDYLNKAVAKIIDYSLENHITKIVIGWNKGLKDGGVKPSGDFHLKGRALRRVNQMFTGVPLARLRDKLEFKCKENGIVFLAIDEGYTSKRSFYDGDSPFTIRTKGDRIKRGLFKTESGFLVNADINAAFNILLKGECKMVGFDRGSYNSGLILPRKILIPGYSLGCKSHLKSTKNTSI